MIFFFFLMGVIGLSASFRASQRFPNDASHNHNTSTRAHPLSVSYKMAWLVWVFEVHHKCGLNSLPSSSRRASGLPALRP